MGRKTWLEEEILRQMAEERKTYLKSTNPLHDHDNQSELDLVTDGDHDARTDNPHGVDEDDVLPDQTGNSGKYLTTDGASSSWAAVAGGTIDHGELTGLADDDHTQYPSKNGWDQDYSSSVTLSFVDGTRTFSITPTGANFSFWCDGTQYTKSSADSVVISDTEGLWFIYYVGSTLTASQTPWSIADNDKAFVAILYWDADNDECILLGYELHSWVMDPATHAHLHLSSGSVYGSGFLPGSLVIDGDGDSNSHAQLSMASGVFFDEDIKFSISDGSPQDISPILQAPVYYRSGANGYWRKITATDYPLTTTGTGRAAYNEWTGATWQLTEVTNNDFVLVHLLATNDVSEPIIAIVGQEEYTTLGNARAGAETEMNTLQLGDVDAMTPEFIPLATFIVQTSDGYANAVQSRFRSTDTGDDYIDWRGANSAGTSGTGGSDHGSLSGLADDDHTQYHNDTRGDARYSQLGHSHTASDVTDFDTEVGNHTDVAANTTHRTSSGADHTYIDQAVTTTSNPTFADLTVDTIEVNEVVTFDAIHNTSDSGSVTVDFNNGNKAKLTPTGNITGLTLTLPGVGNYMLHISNASDYTIAWTTTVKWPGGTAPDTDDDCLIAIYYDGTTAWGTYGEAMA